MAEEFTFEAAAAHLDEIGRSLFDEDFADDGWEAIAIVVQVDGMLSSHGFKYYADGTVKPGSQIPVGTMFKFEDMADSMEKLNGRRWKTCLIQVKKPEAKMRIQYEYDDVNRWMVTPANLDEMREALRPE